MSGWLWQPRASRFVIYDPIGKRPVMHVGTSSMRGRLADYAYRFAERECGTSLMFDDTCPHGTAVAICSECGAS